MDSAALLDLLGNENRRRILRLLARKPCYVTEISESLGVSPKAVIDHLRKLEEAGLVESHTDERRRKYFRIARNVRLEVNVGPYGFGTKSAYAANSNLDVTTLRHLSIDVEFRGDDDLSKLAGELRSLDELQNELSLAQRLVQGRLTEVLDRLTDRMDGDLEFDERLYADILLSLTSGPLDSGELARGLNVPEPIVTSALSTMAEEGVVTNGDEGWQLAD
ncbi:MAG TPA: metalloregulator ArsR/SmtB family transcription factor [Natrialbaceae archaeon]|nr:metalloregulator ArsR/SmtB family transcription factor [Natrialbaceae archaeon]